MKVEMKINSCFGSLENVSNVFDKWNKKQSIKLLEVKKLGINVVEYNFEIWTDKDLKDLEIEIRSCKCHKECEINIDKNIIQENKNGGEND